MQIAIERSWTFVRKLYPNDQEHVMPTQTGDVFETIPLHLAGTSEQVVVGGRDKFPLLSAAFAGVQGFVDQPKRRLSVSA